jgi:acylphosphatase
MKHIHINISGKVENTGFRFHVFMGASMLGICGFVLIKDSHIIIEAEGEDANLTDFGEWCRRGPEGSSIESLIFSDKDFVGYEDFKIL